MRMKKRYGRRLLIWLLVAVFAVALCEGRRLIYDLYSQKYSGYVEHSAEEFDLDPLLVYAFICTESGFEPQAASDAGARGLMQITNETYSWIHSKLEPDTPEDFSLMFDPAANIRYGCYYVAACLERYNGDVRTAAAAYHSGWGTVDRLLEKSQYSADGACLDDFPYANMNRYVKKIEGNYKIYHFLYPQEDVQ